MAVTKPLKLRMYEGITALNQSFEQVLQDFKRLRGLQIFPQKFLYRCEGRLEQLRADANCELVRVLQSCEAADSAHFSNMMVQVQRRAARSRKALQRQSVVLRRKRLARRKPRGSG